MYLRDIFITGFVAAVLPFVFRHAFIGILLWTWVSVMNPHKLAYGYIYSAPIAAVIGGVTLISLFTTRDRVKLPSSSPLVFIGLFLIWTCITTINAFYVPESMEQLEKVLKIQLMVFVSAAVLYKWEHIRLFIWINVLSLAYYGVKGGIFTIRSGGGERVWGPEGTFIAGNNELALALIMVIPLMYYLFLTACHPWVKRGLLVMIMLSAVSAIGTQSRGALVAIAAMGAVLWWRAPNKLINGLLVSVLAISIGAFMPQSWHNRMSSIQNYEQDGSAMGRIFAWQTAVNIANHRVTGAGYDMYYRPVFAVYAPEAGDSTFNSKQDRAAHSIYFQVLGEHGYLGLFLYLMIWITAWRISGTLRKGTREDPDLAWLYKLGSMAQVSLVGYAVGGAFLSLAYWDVPYHLVVVLVIARRWRQERGSLPEIEPPVPPADLARRGIFERAMWWARRA